MIDLPNGCSYSKPYVNPCDWDLPGAFLDSEWYIEYWFFDPCFKDTFPKGKRCNFKKGFIKAKTLGERRALVKKALKDIEQNLERGYNPIIKQSISPSGYLQKTKAAQAAVPCSISADITQQPAERPIVSKILGHEKEETTQSYFDVNLIEVIEGVKNVAFEKLGIG